jgi:Protein of unknown function (DUF2997)
VESFCVIASEKNSMNMRALAITTLMVGLTTQAFRASPAFTRSRSSLKMSDTGGLETIEFRIYPDGRVEETVRGIKGGNCHKVTEAINEVLGKVIDTAPTEELYEQELVVDQTVTLTEGTGGGWEALSSW